MGVRLQKGKEKRKKIQKIAEKRVSRKNESREHNSQTRQIAQIAQFSISFYYFDENDASPMLQHFIFIFRGRNVF